MEVPVVNGVDDLQLTVGRLPSLISQLLIELVPEIFSFWKWGAVILAVYAIVIVNSLLVRFEIEIITFGKPHSAGTKALPSYSSDEDYDCSSDDDVSVSGSSVDEDDDDEDEEEEKEEVSSSSYDAPFGRSFFDFRVRNSEKEDSAPESNHHIPRRFSWSNFANGKSVVKLWDGIGIGLHLSCSSSGGLLSFHDLNHDDAITSFFPTEICETPAFAMPSPSLVLSAGKDRASNLSLSLADARIGRQALFTNTKVPTSAISAIESDSLQKVYVSDDAGKKLVGLDLRKATAQLDDGTELDGVTWWDADGGDDVELKVSRLPGARF